MKAVDIRMVHSQSQPAKPPSRPLGHRLKRATLGLATLAARSVGHSSAEAAYVAAELLQACSRPFDRGRKADIDLCFVVKDGSGGWILEAICREIAAFCEDRWAFAGTLDRLPSARTYFFSHYHFYLEAMRRNPHLWDRPCAVLVTHPKEERRDFGGPAAIRVLSRARLISMCSMWSDLLVELGVPAGQITLALGGADPAFFGPHPRGGGKVGLCAAYYDRKSPERIVELVRSLPGRSFILMGRNWHRSPGFADLLALPNFEYREGAYADYPAFYRELDVFVSLAKLEGGPIPLIEAMMSNVVPVATRTGFAPDLIRHGENGYLCDIDAPLATIASLIELASANPRDVRGSVEHLSWRRFAELVRRQLSS
ncbi:MAG: glycosyltransferase [Planctomycetes bacterium]|nr:glycosyltransferase [Planctomycetota bacterium]